MSKPKRYPRARSAMHARVLHQSGLPVRRLSQTVEIGPYSPLVLAEGLRYEHGWSDEVTAKFLALFRLAATGKVVRYGSRTTARPAGNELVIVQIKRSS
jgi:hypothetical protein